MADYKEVEDNKALENVIQRDDKIWGFNVGGDVFVGNPKWLYIYINKYRKDIDAYWFCNSQELVKDLRKQGFKAYKYDDTKSINIQARVGVFVSDQVKEVYPEKIRGAKFLNLWHGVGIKKDIERTIDSGFIFDRIAKKYIRYNDIYANDQVFLATSKFMEQHFTPRIGLRDDNVIRAGYPVWHIEDIKDYSSFKHDIRGDKHLDKDTKIALYAPTYRSNGLLFTQMIPEIDKLKQKLEEENILLIFKMHKLIAEDPTYLQLKESYSSCKNMLFWNNELDVYEIFDQIDIAIVDYSSILYDLMKAGVKNFIRYIFDYDTYSSEYNIYDYKELSAGQICEDFDSLVDALSKDCEISQEDIDKLNSAFFGYDDENAFEKIIESTLAFEKANKELPTLYSFDIFDTLIQRKTLQPVGIFYYVQDMIKKSNLDFPTYFYNNYVEVRRRTESAVRDYYRKSTHLRHTDKIEINFYDIFARIKEIYDITDEQVEALINWELEGEYKNVIPRNDEITKLKELVANGEKVILISDMYLPKELIIKLLSIVDEDLTKIPLYLSSEIGYQKSTTKLYLEIYRQLDYNFGEWVHFGDNVHADGKQAKNVFIKPEVHTIMKFNGYEQGFINQSRTYDSFLFARILADFRFNNEGVFECFTYSYMTLYLYSYVSWILDDAKKKGIKTLYFLARDGHYLKIIAEEILKYRDYEIEIKYFYGSRKTMRIPSFINEIDEEYYSEFGNFVGINSYEDMLKALTISEEDFRQVLPELSSINENTEFNEATVDGIKLICKNSVKFNQYILNLAKEQRVLSEAYIKQEVNLNEKFAFVDYWGRGYTQDCFARIINNISDEEIDVPFYNVRTIYPTIGRSVRYNMFNSMNLVFIEPIFTIIPYYSIEEYEYGDDGKVVPVINLKENSQEISENMAVVEQIMRQFCSDINAVEFLDRETIEREIFDYALAYLNRNKDVNKTKDKYIKLCYGQINYQPDVYASESTNIDFDVDVEIPPFTLRDIYDRVVHKKHFKEKTFDIDKSIENSSTPIKMMFRVRHDVKGLFKK